MKTDHHITKYKDSKSEERREHLAYIRGLAPIHGIVALHLVDVIWKLDLRVRTKQCQDAEVWGVGDQQIRERMRMRERERERERMRERERE